MKVVTYLAFTLLSIVINFVVMDFIQEKIKIENKTSDLNLSGTKKHIDDILKHYGEKPHAIYYRKINIGKMERSIALSTKTYSNTSLLESLESSTDIGNTIIDMFYDENFSTTGDSLTVTEPLTTESDNVTEITLFDTKNASTVKPAITKTKKTVTKDCSCNLLYNVCDINCCCDYDCTDDDRKFFMCVNEVSKKDQHTDDCIAYLSFSTYLMDAGLESLFCVVRNNFPDKRILNRVEHDESVITNTFKWHSNARPKTTREFTSQPYKTGDPLWVLKDGNPFDIDLPARSVSNYCTSRKAMKFLINEKNTCNVKLTDLEMFHILSLSKVSSVVSVTEKSANNPAFNCTHLHCTEWKLSICNDTSCSNYDESVHEPNCTENVCTNIARRVDYTFYYHESKITNATVKLFVQRISLNVPFIKQVVNVRFVMGNESVEKIIELSGNPGYINGRPVIASFKENKHSNNFYNTFTKKDKYLSLPRNKNGICVKSKISDKFVLFGRNSKLKCRHIVGTIKSRNATVLCKYVQNSINEVLGLNTNGVVCPYGNPQNVKDEEWVTMKSFDIETPLYGSINRQKSILNCYNVITSISFVFIYVDASEMENKRENKILSSKLEITSRNFTFNLDEISAVVSIDTMFIDETRPRLYEYAGGPQLRIHLPKGFFYPFPSSKACEYRLRFSEVFIVVTSFVIFNYH